MTHEKIREIGISEENRVNSLNSLSRGKHGIKKYECLANCAAMGSS